MQELKATDSQHADAASGVDKFYTRPSVVGKCLGHLDLDDYDCVIEPSAGNGAFLEQINHRNLVAIDIAPECSGVKRADYLRYTICPDHQRVLVVGNPPFGIKHALSDAFLLHSFIFCNVQTIGFILPNTYRKHTRQKIIPSNWRIKEIVSLGDSAFTYEGEVYHVPCSFFVFDKSDGPCLRVDPDQYKNAVDFDFGTKDDYTAFLFGANPRKLIKSPKPNNRGYFIKPHISFDELQDKLNAIDWQGNSCASGGVAWFTKTEVVMHYNRAYA